MKTMKTILTVAMLVLSLNSAFAGDLADEMGDVQPARKGNEVMVKMTGQAVDPADVAKAQYCEYAYQWACNAFGCGYRYIWVCF